MVSIAIEGDFIETKKKGLIFDVKGLLHPKDKIICFLRYYPDSNGDKIRNDTRYSKIYDLKQRYEFLRKNYPDFVFYSNQTDMELQGVNIKEIKQIYKPKNCYKNLKKADNLSQNQQKALNFCDILINNTQITNDNIGITGSIMVGLDGENSDIDVIIYETDISKRIQEELKKIYLNEKIPVRKYNSEEFKKHYEFRADSSGISFENFMRSEKHKLHQGKFQQTDFFIRYIKSPQDWPGKFSDYLYKNYGRIKLKAEILDSSDSIFTPCSYKIKPLRLLELVPLSNEIELNQIHEICSFRGRFCEQAIDQEKVYIEGKLEKVLSKKKNEYFRIILGEYKEDKMMCCNNTN